MKLPNRERLLSSAVLIAVAATLVLLAVFQYLWSEQAMKASTARISMLLRSSMLDWHMEFFHQFSDICLALHVNPVTVAGESEAAYAQRFQQWQETAQYPGLVANLYVWRFGPDASQILRLNDKTSRFEPDQWKAKLLPLRGVLASKSGNLALALAASNEPEYFFGPSHDYSRKPHESVGSDPFAGWMFDAGIPALVHAIARDGQKAGPESDPKRMRADWIVVELDPEILGQKLLPDLTRRFFSAAHGLEYEVAVIASEDEKHSVLFESDPDLDKRDEDSADAVMDVLGSRRHREIPLGWPDKKLAAEASDDEPHGGAAESGPPPLWFPLIRDTGSEPDWDLMVWHRNGSLTSQAAKLRWRNLGVSFGAIGLLGISIAMLVYTTRRAQQLADKEINFMAAISHELRTPLAVISSAADNLADGVVQGKEQLARYGTVIQSQSRQLADLVEQILLFAATRQGSTRYAFSPLPVRDVIEVALRNTDEFIRQAGVTVEQDISPNLPRVLGDRTALSQILQNLITNAVKYGGSGKWIGIKAAPADGSSSKEVQVSIQDKGIGMSEEELEKIFEPFYRSPVVSAAQIHGTGLGLPLARSIAEGMGGRLTVQSKPGVGSTFTLHLRSADVPGTTVTLAPADPKATQS